MISRLYVVGISALVGLGQPVAAQSNTANTTAPVHGQTSRIPQFPSGGVPAKTDSKADHATRSASGEPTEVERRAQRDADRVMQICKGC